MQTYLTERFFVLLGLLLLSAVVALVVPTLTLVPLFGMPLVLITAFIDRLALPRRKAMIAEATLPRTPALGETTEVSFLLTPHQGKMLLPRRMTLSLPQSKTLRFSEEFSEIVVERKPGRPEIKSVVKAVAAKLGFDRVDRLRLLCWSPIGLWMRALELEMKPTSFRVIPSRTPATSSEYTEVRSQQRMLFQGSRQRFRSANPDEFKSTRPYRFPDPVRYLDHKKTAKYGELMTREFDSFFDHHLVIGLDVGRALRGDIQGSSKLDFYLAASLSLAENAIGERDRVSFFSFSQKVHYSIKATRHLHPFQPIFEGHPGVAIREEESNYDLLLPTLQRLSGTRSLFVLFTDASKPSVQEALKKNLPAICQKHLTLVVSVSDEKHAVDTRLEALGEKTLTMRDYSDLLHSYWVEDGIPDVRHHLGRHGGGLVRITHTHWLDLVNRLHHDLRLSSTM